MFEFKACVVLKIKEFTFVNNCFQNKHNAEIGHYGQTLISFISRSDLFDDQSKNHGIEKGKCSIYHCW